ncbi:MAG: transcriptional regulator [bacterium P3]|nr:MAG: transcriptional regulator [bacterium P3]KWW41939.1 MAG: transcriptional regulator [bacterium F083]
MSDVRENIISYASSVFLKNGCRKVTMDGIALGMHISKRTLYEQFANKEELLTACLRHLHADIDEHMRQMYDEIGDMLFLVFFMTNAMSIVTRSMSLLLREMMQYYPELFRAEVLSHDRPYYDYIHEILKEAEAAGRLRKHIDIDLTIDSFRLLMNYMHLDSSDSFISGFTFEDRHVALVSELICNFFRGLLSEETIRCFDRELEQRKKKLTDNIL